MRAALLAAIAVAVTSTARAANVSENFDGVTAPALPVGWTATNFTIIGSDALSAPNRAFAAEPAATTNAFLNSPTFAITTPFQVRFQHRYKTETAGPSGPFDGGILEVSYDGGAFVDVLTAGGTFIEGGYDAKLVSTGSNPLAGKRAWTGDSGGFVRTIINLPAPVGGEVRLAFRFGADAGGAGDGWSIDDFQIFDSCELTCPEAVTADAEAGVCGAVAEFGKADTTNCGAVLMYPPSGSFFDVGKTTVTAVSEAGPFCETTVTVADKESPTITCPGDVVIDVAPGVCQGQALFVPPAGIDNCTSTSVCSVSPGDVLPPGTTAVTCTATDGGSRSASCTFNVTISLPEGEEGGICEDKQEAKGCASVSDVSPLAVLIAALAIYCRLSRSGRGR